MKFVLAISTTIFNMQDEVDPSEFFSSPIKPSDLPSQPKTPRTPKTPTPGGTKEKEPFDAEEVRSNALRRELEGVRNINEVIEGVIGTLERAKGNMGVSPLQPCTYQDMYENKGC